MERSIGATDPRQRLTDVLRAVREQGETYIVETFGRLSATPLEPQTAARVAETLTMLEEE